MERCGLVDTVQMTKAVRNLEIMAYWVEYNVRLFVLGNRIVQKDTGDLKTGCYKEKGKLFQCPYQREQNILGLNWRWKDLV